MKDEAEERTIHIRKIEEELTRLDDDDAPGSPSSKSAVKNQKKKMKKMAAKIDLLTQNVSKLEQTNTAKNSELLSVSTKLKKLGDERPKLEQDLASALSKISNFETEQLSLLQDIKTYKERCDQVGQQPDNTEEVDALKGRISELEADLQSQTDQLQQSATTEEVDSLKGRISELEADLQLQADQLQQSAGDSNQLAELQQQYDEIDNNFKEATANNERLEAQVSDSTTQLTDLQKQLEEVTSARDELKVEVDDLRNTSSQLLESQAECEETRSKLESLESEKQQLQSEINAHNEASDISKQTIESLEIKIQQLTQEAGDESSQLEAFRSEVDALKAENTELQTTVSELQEAEQHLHSLREEAAAAKEQISKLEKELSDNNNTHSEIVSQREADNDLLVKQISQKSDELSSVEQNRQDLLDTLTEKDAVILQLSDSEAALSSQLADLRTELEAAKAEVETSTKTLEEGKQQTASFESRVADLEDDLKASLLANQQAIVSMNDELEAERRNVTNCKKELQALQEENQRLVDGGDERDGEIRLRIGKEWKERLTLKEEEVDLIAGKLSVEKEARGTAEADNEELKSKVSDLTTQNTELKEASNQLESERLKRMEAEASVERLKTTIQSEEETQNELQRTIADLRHKEHSVGVEYKLRHQEEMIEVREELDNVKAILSQRSDEIERLQHINVSLVATNEDRLRAAEKHKIETAATISELEEQLALSREAEEASDNKVTELHERIFNLSSEQRLREEALDALYKESQQKDKFMELTEEITTLTNKIQQTEEDLDVARNETATVRETLSQELSLVNEKFKQREDNIQSQAAQIRQLEDSVKKSTRRNTNSDLRSRSASPAPHSAVIIDQGATQQQKRFSLRSLNTNNYIGIAIFLLLFLGFYNSLHSAC
eukprot:TRINITY_DN582_c0_g1_i10.p1 TRINITY_DN582_c0_g1~~TRINITY_DN582_c0_g1_i10.p1  ORF type:complete len:904 (+),score=291.76 TRINITY_DN582_c0_g1_i10:1118-3829(+)